MKSINMAMFGLSDRFTASANAYPGMTVGRIIAQEKGSYRIISENGEQLGEPSGKFYHEAGTASDFPAVGDFVMLSTGGGDGSAMIRHVLPRKSVFVRKAAGSAHIEQVVAANIDTVFICMALDNDFNPRRLERYLTICWESGAIPVVVLTKSDLCERADEYAAATRTIAVGVDVIAVNTKAKGGYTQVLPNIKEGQTIALVGSSGVGKSTLINALLGEERIRTGDLQRDGRGRHITTRRELFLLPGGGLVIDTPGMREVGMWDISDGLEKSFSDVEAFLGQCKFSDCLHQSEPGCAVKAAICRGELSQERFESYLRLGAESQYACDKEGYLQRKEQFFKQISMINKLGDKRTGKVDFRLHPCEDSFICKVCGKSIVPEHAGSRHRNHCPYCLSSIHADNKPGDRASLCKGIMDPISVWAREGGEWAIIHRCRACGVLHSNRIAADDSPGALMTVAKKALEHPPFPITG